MPKPDAVKVQNYPGIIQQGDVATWAYWIAHLAVGADWLGSNHFCLRKKQRLRAVIPKKGRGEQSGEMFRRFCSG